MDELKKVKHIGYNSNNGCVNYEEDSLQFNEGDKQVAFIHLRGAMPNYIQSHLKIRTPNGEVILLTGKVITNNKNVCREFAVVVDQPGVYNCQLILSYKEQVNISNIFTYKVNSSIEGGI